MYNESFQFFFGIGSWGREITFLLGTIMGIQLYKEKRIEKNKALIAINVVAVIVSLIVYNYDRIYSDGAYLLIFFGITKERRLSYSFNWKINSFVKKAFFRTLHILVTYLNIFWKKLL